MRPTPNKSKSITSAFRHRSFCVHPNQKRPPDSRKHRRLVICTIIAAIIVWRGLTYDHGVADFTTASISIALAISLVFHRHRPDRL